MLEITDFALCDGAVAELTGIFPEAGTYSPFPILLENASRSGFMRSIFPPHSICVIVRKPPPSVAINVEMPTLFVAESMANRTCPADCHSSTSSA
jgi:hypothetical protein